MFSELCKYNDFFAQNNSEGNITADEVFVYLYHGSRVCLSAPHATKSFANKQPKKCDLYTGAIVRYIAERYNYDCIFRQKYLPQKTLISDFILQHNLTNHFFLDIHAMKEGTGFDLAVGTAYMSEEQYAQPLQIIAALCRKYQLNYVINHPDYTGKFGLTGRLQKATGYANVLQLEWRLAYRDIFNNFDNVSKTSIPFLKDLCDELTTVIR